MGEAARELMAESAAEPAPEPATFEVDFEPAGRRVRVAAGTHLLDAARSAGVGLASVCGGDGTCGRCRVVVM
ncbi:MAG TPA: 2Fe-2S iron-sulfur cluster-binding protein, partial [Candidatus Limnocylindrales bacterium]